MARQLIIVLLCVTTLAGCVRRQAVVTGSTLSGATITTGSWLREELYFGRAIPGGGMVSDSAFSVFVEREIATRLPEGFTLIDALGYWRGADGRTIREPSSVLVVYYRDSDTGKARALTDLIAIYKRAFRQESVLRVALPARVTF